MLEWKQEVRRWLVDLKLEPTREEEIVEELSQHLDDRYAELLSQGSTHDEAARLTFVELSESEPFQRRLQRVERKVVREPLTLGINRRKNMITDLWQDLRYGARMLVKRPVFTLIALLTLSLGIGANTAMFSVVNAVLLCQLPFPEPERLMLVEAKNPDHFAAQNARARRAKRN